MCENGTGHEEARGPTRRRLCCTAFQNFSQRERDVEECHRRPKRRMYLLRAKDRLACRFRLDGRMEASRLHAAVPPTSWSPSAATTALTNPPRIPPAPHRCAAPPSRAQATHRAAAITLLHGPARRAPPPPPPPPCCAGRARVERPPSSHCRASVEQPLIEHPSSPSDHRAASQLAIEQAAPERPPSTRVGVIATFNSSWRYYNYYKKCHVCNSCNSKTAIKMSDYIAITAITNSYYSYYKRRSAPRGL